MSKNGQVVLSKDKSIVARHIDNEVILVPVRQRIGDLQCIYTTNEVGSQVWSLIDGKRSLQEILEIVVKDYDVAYDEAKVDIDEFIRQLVEAGCINAES